MKIMDSWKSLVWMCKNQPNNNSQTHVSRLCLFCREDVRTASATAVGDVTCLVIDRESVRIFVNHEHQFLYAGAVCGSLCSPLQRHLCVACLLCCSFAHISQVFQTTDWRTGWCQQQAVWQRWGQGKVSSSLYFGPSVCRGLCKSNFSRVYVFLPFSLWIKAWVNGNLTRSHPLTFLFTPPARLKTELTDRALVQTSTEVVLVVNDLRQRFHSCFTITGSLIRRSADIHKFGTWKHIHQAATSPNINRLKSQQPQVKADRMANETQKHKIYWSTYTNARTALKHSVKTNK